MALHFQATALHGQHHFRAQILIVVGGRNRKISLAVTRTVSQIIFFAAGIPASLFSVNVIKAVLLALIKAHVVEDEELGLSSEVGGVGDSAGAQIKFCLARNVARIAVVALLGHGIDHI